MQQLGIERGIKGSKATHTKVKEYYQDVNRDSLNLDLEEHLPQPIHGESAVRYKERVKEFLQPTLDIINHQLSHRQWLLLREEELEKTALASFRERQKLEQRVKELVAEVFQWKQQAEGLRDLPLEDVAYDLGLEEDDKGRHRWKGQGHIISIDGSKFYDLGGEQRGGGGAIDLVMHVKGCEFKQAVAWLSDCFGTEGMLKAVRYHAGEQATLIAKGESAPRFTPPTPDESRWPAVHHYLTHTRKLPENWVKALHASGLVYADDRQNAVFVQRSLDGKITGAFVRPTTGLDNTFLGLAPGSKRSAGWFYMRCSGSETDLVQRAVLTKSPIDALSKAVLDQPHSQRTLYLATDSARSLPYEFLREVSQVVVAYDNDAAGNETAKQIKQLVPHATRHRPKAKDWNEELQAQLQRSKEQDGLLSQA